MKIDLNKIAHQQLELDNFIHHKKQLKFEETFHKRKLAFLVELGELLNEIRCFKFWSTKKASKKDILLEEYIDGLHFIISLGNDIKNENWYFELTEMNTNNINDHFMSTYNLFLNFNNDSSIQNYQKVLKNFLELILILHFNVKDITEAYNKKRQINIDRQNTNY